MLRIALLTDRLGHPELSLLRGLREFEFHLVTVEDPGPVPLPPNVLSHSNLPTHLPSSSTRWRTVEAAARHVCRGYPRSAEGPKSTAGPAGTASTETPPSSGTRSTSHTDRMLTAGLRLLSHVAGDGTGTTTTTTRARTKRARNGPRPEVLHPTFGPHPLAGLKLDALGSESLAGADADMLASILRTLALRLPPVHLIHAFGVASGLAALAHNWRRGTPYLLSRPSPHEPFARLCHQRAHRVVQLSPALDPADYPPRRTEPNPPTALDIGPSDTPLGAEFFASAAMVTVTGGVSYPLIEAMLCGLPVVAAEAEGVADIVADTGLVVPGKDLPAARDLLLADRALRWELGLQARRRALERHSIGPWLAAHESHYVEAAMS